MSKIKEMLELESPMNKTRRERLEGEPRKCNYCSGNGWFWGCDEYGQGTQKQCPMCKGKGVLRPVITIDWEATV